MMQNRVPVVVVLGTGGTIAGTAKSPAEHTEYAAAQLRIGAVVAAVPALRRAAIECEQVAQIDSKDMGHATWQLLAQRVSHHLARADVEGIVIAHGTDTLEETAYFLHRVLAPVKPVVLTGAMRPATSSQADGPHNLADAVCVATAPNASGVMAVLAGVVHGARAVCKVHPTRLDAFSSGDAGPLGRVDGGVVQWSARGGRGGETASGASDLVAVDDAADALAVGLALTRPVIDWPRVDIVVSHAGANGAIVRALCVPSTDRRVDGIVVAATGNGTLHHDLESALLGAQAHGVAVLCSLRCAAGRVPPNTTQTQPLAASKDLSPVKARIELMLALMQRGSP